MSTDTIEVYCDDRSHEPRRWTWPLARGEDHWHADDTPDQRLRHTASVVQYLAAPGGSGPARARYKFECELCGRCVEGRGDRVTPMLDALSQHGQRTVSLRLLAAIL